MNSRTDSIKQTLLALGVKPEKRFGQNFLIDQNAIDTICRFVGDITNDTVLEIGPGLGAITGDLLSKARSYFAVELERNFCGYLAEAFPALASENRILQADIRSVELTPERFGSTPLTVVSNLPYSISSEVCLWLFAQQARIGRVSLLLQREFAERLAASPGTRECGSLSVLRCLYADARLGPIISGAAFFPKADVESRLLSLTFLAEPRSNIDRMLFERVVRASFSTRRKTLANALSHSGTFGTKATVESILSEAGIDSKRRAETLSLEEFVGLVRKIEEYRITFPSPIQ